MSALPVTSASAEDAALLPSPHLDYVPIGFFGSVMGLTGLSVAWRLAHARLGTPLWIATAIGDLAIVTFVLVSIGYLLKVFHAPDKVRAEFAHPILGNLFGTLLISLLLLPIVLAPYSVLLAQAMWIIGAVGMVVFAWLIATRWLSERHQFVHATPAWIVPVVGMLDVPLALPALGITPLHDVMVLCLAVGLFFTMPLFTLIVMRLVFEPPMPGPLAPSLLILVAPFAVGMSTYVVVTGHVDLFAQGLFAVGVFVLATVLGRLRYLIGCCPFRLSWWAVGFPLAASAIAAFRVAEALPHPVHDVLAAALLAVATITIVALVGRTLYGIGRGELRTLSQ